MINLMSFLSNTTFLLGFLFLLWFTYIDLKKSEIDNSLVLTLLGISLIWAYTNPYFIMNIVLMGFVFAFSLYLWNKGSLGGADCKILPLIVPFLGLKGWGEGIAGLIGFMILFAIIGGIYGIMAKLIIKNKEVPFLPAILLSYLAFWLPKFIS